MRAADDFVYTGVTPSVSLQRLFVISTLDFIRAKQFTNMNFLSQSADRE